MFRIPVRGRIVHGKSLVRLKSSSSYIRSTFIEYFVQQHGHKHIKSSSVVPLCDPSVPFVNAGMNQFKSVFLGRVDPPCARAVNSQKCVRVGGKHNDLEVVGTDGHHHTFFEMMGNWSFGDYYKKEACKMAWELLLGPYRFKPENLLVTYFLGDVIIGLTEDRECRDIWKEIGVPPSRIKALGAPDNFWEMGATGPCGPSTEIHYIHPDGSLTEIWNIVFIQGNREADGKVRGLRKQHVDTGLGLERVTALIQGVPSNYDTDLFTPIIRAIERNSGGAPAYGGRFGADAALDSAYRRLADHARMISVCLADGVYPNESLNLKQIMRKSFKISTDVFKNPHMLQHLYDEVAATLGPTYPELVSMEKDVKTIIGFEELAYERLRVSMGRKWCELVTRYPEVEPMADVEMAGFALGYKEFKEVMAKLDCSVMPGDLVFKLYDTHGFQEDIIARIASLNNFTVDREGFSKLLAQHKARHKTAIKEQTEDKHRGKLFDEAIDKLQGKNITCTDDSHKYKCSVINNKIELEPVETRIIALLDDNGEWLDLSEPNDVYPYYIVTKDTNFYCEAGGQVADVGHIRINDSAGFNVQSVFKIREFVFHKGCFVLDGGECNYVKVGDKVTMEVDEERRVSVMRNHTAVHLLNAAIRKVLPDSVVCQVGSSVTEQGLSLTLSIYGQKLTQDVLMRAQDLIRESVRADTLVETRVVDSLQLAQERARAVPGERYPDTGLRLVDIGPPLPSKELCCGTHVPSTAHVGELCVTRVRAAAGHAPAVHALSGPRAREARELFCRAHQLYKVVDLLDPVRRKEEVASMKQQLAALCVGSGAPYGEFAECLAVLDKVKKKALSSNAIALHAIAEEEIRDATLEAEKEGRRFVVHFLRCSYIMPSEAVARALRAERGGARPTLLLGCAGGVVGAACSVPRELVSPTFSARRWLESVLAVFAAGAAPAQPGRDLDTYAEMTDTKVSLITCEQLVQDAMRAAVTFARAHAHTHTHSPGAHASRRTN